MRVGGQTRARLASSILIDLQLVQILMRIFARLTGNI